LSPREVPGGRPLGPAERTGNYAIRTPCIADREALREFLTGLSPRASYLRFFSGAPPASQATLRMLTGGAAQTDVLVATDGATIIGHAMAGDRTDPGGRLTEIGVVVADGYRGLGVGSALVRRLLGQAQLRGVTAVIMEVLAENRQVLTMITDHWPVAHQERAGAYITVHAPLPPGLRPEQPAPWSPAEEPLLPGASEEPWPPGSGEEPGPPGAGEEPWPPGTGEEPGPPGAGEEPWFPGTGEEPWPGTGKKAVPAAIGGGPAR
jgi:GNAT superfamily N-acetyltransferase